MEMALTTGEVRRAAARAEQFGRPDIKRDMAGHQKCPFISKRAYYACARPKRVGKKEDFESLASFHFLAIRYRSHYRIIEILQHYDGLR